MVPTSEKNASPSRLLAARGLLAPAAHALRLVLARLPLPVQKLGGATLRRMASRWPLLARLLGAKPAAPPTCAPAPQGPPAVLAEQLARLRQAPDYGERARAAQALGRVTSAEATAALVSALRDRSAEVASQAAESLARHGGAGAARALRVVVENEDGFFSSATRASAVRALGQILPAADGSTLVAAVADVDALVSLAAIAALAERDDALSAGALMTVLEDGRGFYLPLTRQAAARALQCLHQYDRDRLRGLLEREFDSTVRDALSSLAN